MSTDQIFAQSEDLNNNSSEMNKSSNKTLIRNNLTSSLLFRPQLNLSLNLSAAAASSPSAVSSAAASSPSPISSITNEVKGDFNGDGFDDLAIGVPFEDVITEAGTLETAGAVNIIYGSSTGLSATTLDRTNYGRRMLQV